MNDSLDHRILIYGGGGGGRVTLDILRAQHGGRLTAVFIDDDESKAGSEVEGVTVLAPSALAATLAQGFAVVVAVGDNHVRALIYRKLTAMGFRGTTAVHPGAIVSARAELSAGCVVMPGAVINTGARIGEDACVNTATALDHDVILGAHVNVFPGARLTGNVTVGALATISSGAVIAPGVKVGANAIVGAQALVLADVPENAVVFGIPARVRRYRQPLAQSP